MHVLGEYCGLSHILGSKYFCLLLSTLPGMSGFMESSTLMPSWAVLIVQTQSRSGDIGRFSSAWKFNATQILADQNREVV